MIGKMSCLVYKVVPLTGLAQESLKLHAGRTRMCQFEERRVSLTLLARKLHNLINQTISLVRLLIHKQTVSSLNMLFKSNLFFEL